MIITACLLLWTVDPPRVPQEKPIGFVTHAGRDADGVVRPYGQPYCPRAGDIVLFDDFKMHWLILYHLVGSAPPTHSGIVVQLPNGQFGLLESGPDDGKLIGPYVGLLDLESRLRNFNGALWIRQVQRPLSPERSAALTQFAFSQVGKRYATGRLLLQGTPFRVRNSLTRKLFGKTHHDRGGWLCSELVVAGGTVAGLFDAQRHPANAIYPLDMVQDTTFDLSGVYLKSAVWSWERLTAPAGEAAQPSSTPRERLVHTTR